MAPEGGRCQNLLIQNRQNIQNQPPSNNITVTAVEQNRHLLNTLFKFKRGAKLKEYLIDKSGTEKHCYSLAEILTILKEVISKEKMFDDRNPFVILCSKALERALDQKALHVTEVRDLVLSQVDRLPDQTPRSTHSPSQPSQPRAPASIPRPRGPTLPDQSRVIRTASIANSIKIDANSKYRLQPAFLEVARSVPGSDPKQEIFSYEEVTLLLSKYILSKKDQIFDQRNIKLALVENDPLGKAFGVTAFLRCQVNTLLRAQLIPLNSDSDQPAITSTSSPGVSLSVEDRPVPVLSAKGQVTSSSTAPPSSSSSSLPPFPALSKAASSPSESLLAPTTSSRKRSNSGDLKTEDETRVEKQSRLSSNSNPCSVIVRRSAESEVDSETETIYSEQGYETIKASGENEEEEGAGSSMSAEDGDNREGFDVEYDIDSGDEEERPPQAHGPGREFSSADDTDTDIDEKHKAIAAVENVIESVYWGDSEQEKGEEDEVNINFDRQTSTGKRKCCNCQSPNTFFRYCARCWENRKSWAPERPKNKRKGRKRSQSRSKKEGPETTVQDQDMNDTLGLDDTDGGVPEVDRPRSETMSSQDSGIGTQDLDLLNLDETELVMEPATKSPMDLPNNFQRTLSLDITSSSSGSSVLEAAEHSYATTQKPRTAQSEMCMFCLVRPKNASFIHGRLGHQVCCYPCAKKYWKKQPTCPVCKRKVERIIKIIQA